MMIAMFIYAIGHKLISRYVGNCDTILFHLKNKFSNQQQATDLMLGGVWAANADLAGRWKTLVTAVNGCDDERLHDGCSVPAK